MSNVKIIANYLPQYHETPENNEFWGEGYTDWVAVKKSIPLFNGHVQPKIPLNNNYYQLDDIRNIKWQVDLARKYGLYGFNIYHYWFSSSLHLLGKPAELLLEYKKLDMPFMFTWDNGSWKCTWSNVHGANDWAPKFDNNSKKNDSGMLAELIYGNEEDWKIHFEYLLPFFKDERYIRREDKPLFCIFKPENDFDTINRMCVYWDNLARKNGLKGIFFLSRYSSYFKILSSSFLYEPSNANDMVGVWKARFRNIMGRCFPDKMKIVKWDYDLYWQKLFRQDRKIIDPLIFYGGIVNYDDSPRRGNKGKMFVGATPDKFEKYMKQLIELSQKNDKEFIFLTAWNEWGEGAYLEPDEENGYAYLEALKKAIDETKL